MEEWRDDRSGSHAETGYEAQYVLQEGEEDVLMKKEKEIQVLIVEPGRKPYVKRIPNTLETLQATVGGLIQVLYISADPVAVIVNDEGKLLGLPWNRPLFDEDGEMYDIIAGTFLVTGITKEDFGSLSDSLIDKYTVLFQQGL